MTLSAPQPAPRIRAAAPRPARTGTGPAFQLHVPLCTQCRTDEFLIIESFVPATVLPNGDRRPANVSYTCSHCDQFSGHPVPAGWNPQGWYWYS